MNITEIKEKFNLHISSANGKSVEESIEIKKNGNRNYVELEYFIISHLLNIKEDFEVVRSNQKLLNYKNKTIDYIKVKITDNKKLTERFEEFYFDITNVY